jgi:hypothetical protein
VVADLDFDEISRRCDFGALWKQTTCVTACTRGLRVEYAPRVFRVLIEGKERRYTPDFYFPDEDRYVEVKALRKDGLYNSNLSCVKKLGEMGYNITLVPMREFYQMLRDQGLYKTIPNLENRDYRGTLELIYS